ncbi:rab-like protein 6 isoform X1 [Electrophorus electricus]|uniref:rab-like protein 6 isoform X1 n=1 Tax=Electrophorus electricus TaxID=8005 RepID=UPI0015CFF923|nr:rab-like protein 6 isoform X1 [Electrophorus electricus]XP_026866413.2 rab-like protein 6 isoform X1 [Electrophorus electricus]
MFSALKKLVGSEPLVQQKEKNIPAGLQSMNQSLQRRFAKGVQYNMKIVIRGDRNTGKSTLWQRLQGGKFQEEYIPTQEIQVTSIHWNYKTTDDVVKVEVWDVVDKGQKIPLPEGIGKSKKWSETLKLENEPQESENEMALDAEFLDVYKNCNGVIMMFDITKQWTYNYVLRELPRVPTHMPVCVLGNHRDMGEHRVILPDDIRDFITSLNRPPGSSYIHYAESSMKNGFGLKYLHRFFNIPFLQLQRETLLRQLETNQLDIDATLEELTVQQETEDQNYEIFLEMIESRAKGYTSPAAANGQSPSSGSQSPVVVAGGSSTGSSSPGTPQQPAVGVLQSARSPSSSPSPPPPPLPQGQMPVAPEARSPERPAPCLPSAPLPAPVPAPSPVQLPQKRSFISRLFGSTPAPEHPAAVPEVESVASEAPRTVQSVDDFEPDGGLDKSFLEDRVPSSTKHSMDTQLQAANLDSDSDGEGKGGNPMVAGFQDDLDPDDAEQSRLETRASDTGKHLDITLSSDEGEEMAPPPIAQDAPLELVPSKNLADLNSLTLVETPKCLEAAPSLQPKVTDSRRAESAVLTPAPGQPTQMSAEARGSVGRAAQHGRRKVGVVQGDSSDTDPEGPVAQQMLSFVMDDPDFESEEEHVQKVNKEAFPVRANLSDLSDDDLVPVKTTDPLKPSLRSFKVTDDGDLFGLGIEEKTAKSKESSEEPDEKESRHGAKEKKKKKKKTKEDEEKSSKKKHKHKKKEREEVTGAAEEKEKKKKKSRSKKAGELDDLEAFLAGGEGSVPREEGDYEEL